MSTDKTCLALVLAAAVVMMAGLLNKDRKGGARMGHVAALIALMAFAAVVGDSH
jgi:hypothetical protein